MEISLSCFCAVDERIFLNFYFPILNSSRNRLQKLSVENKNKIYKTWFIFCKDFSNAYYLIENALQYRWCCYIGYYPDINGYLPCKVNMIRLHRS